MDNNEKRVANMSRPELIFEIARHAHPSWYHSMTKWPTIELKLFLLAYRGHDIRHPKPWPPMETTEQWRIAMKKKVWLESLTLVVGIDWGIPGGSITVHHIHRV